jgi:hypothetical protein
MENKLINRLIKQIVQEELSLMEKKKKKDEEVELDLDTPEGGAEIDMEAPVDAPMGGEEDMSMDMSGGDSTEKQIGKGLQMALDAAKSLPDSETKNKLVRQIGNTALFFLKTQIPAGGEQM